MKTLSGLTIFFPAYNDAKSLPTLISKAVTAGKQISRSLEILVINDGSTDNTTAILKTLSKQYPCLRVITHKTNKGYGCALQTGFSHATQPWVFYTDGDGQYDPGELKTLVSVLTPPINVVNGYKRNRADTPLRIFLGKGYNALMHILFRLPIRDVDCDFRLIRTSLIKSIDLHSTSGSICVELITKLEKQGAVFAETAVTHYPRQFGSSQFFQPFHLLHTVRDFARFH